MVDQSGCMILQWEDIIIITLNLLRQVAASQVWQEWPSMMQPGSSGWDLSFSDVLLPLL